MFKMLEELNAQELSFLYAMINDDLNQIASDLFPDAPHVRMEITEKIGQWVINRKTVLEYYASNRPEIAVIFNKICYRIWQQLPSYAQNVRVQV